MKKIVALFLVIILFASCDPPRYYDYYITNSCNEDIVVKIEVCVLNCKTPYSQTNKLNIQINPNTTQLIYSDQYWQPLNENMIEYFFEEITVTKGDSTSKVNYVNKNLWLFEPTSKKHANSYLTVKPEDFEEKQSSGNRR